MTPLAGQAWTGALSLLLAGSAWGADSPAFPATTVGLMLDRQQLSNGLGNWNERSLQIQHAFAKRQLTGVDLSDIERFGQRDTRLGLQYTHPFTERLTVTLEGGFSPSHKTIAKTALGGALQYEFAPAWLVHVGGRNSVYDAVTVNLGLLAIEHYFSNFSWIATWRSSRAFGATANSGEIRGSYYYGDKNSVSLIAAAGKEATSVGTSIVLAELQTVALVGRHWLDRSWAVNYGASASRQGDFYNRSGVNVGIQYAF